MKNNILLILFLNIIFVFYVNSSPEVKKFEDDRDWIIVNPHYALEESDEEDDSTSNYSEEFNDPEEIFESLYQNYFDHYPVLRDLEEIDKILTYDFGYELFDRQDYVTYLVNTYPEDNYFVYLARYLQEKKDIFIKSPFYGIGYSKADSILEEIENLYNILLAAQEEN